MRTHTGEGAKATLGFKDTLNRLQLVPARESQAQSQFGQNWKSAPARSTSMNKAKPSSLPLAAQHTHGGGARRLFLGFTDALDRLHLVPAPEAQP